MSHWTIHEWRKHGVRKCEVLGDDGQLYYRTVLSGLPTRLPKTQVFVTAAMALDAAHSERRRLVTQQLSFWARFAEREIGVET